MRLFYFILKLVLPVLVIIYIFGIYNHYKNYGNFDYLFWCFSCKSEVKDYQKLDHVYLINLDKDTERLDNAKKHLDACNIKFERIPAVNGYVLRIKDLKNNIFFTGQDIKDKKYHFEVGNKYKIYCPTKAIIYDNNIITLSAGEIGLICSNIAIYDDIIKNNYKNSLILEDDVETSIDCKSKLHKTLSNLPEDYDIAYLHYSMRKQKRLFFKNPSFFKIRQDKYHFSSNAAFLLSQDGARKLSKDFLIFNRQLDTYIAALINENHLTAYGQIFFYIYPGILKDKSTIMEMGR